jgi:hypothetical protein
MPAHTFRNMTIEDLEAVYFYVWYIAKNGGATITADKATQDAARSCAQSSDCIAALGETCDPTAKECVGRSCSADSECDVCQTCTGPAAGDAGTGTCVAPAAASMCLTNGL